jgi:phospholipase/carboxylesterase
MAIDSYIHEVSPGQPGGPLVFAFHGTGGDETQLMGLARDLLPQATIVAPRGDVSEQGAARFFRRTGEGVYDMADLSARTHKMARFVEAQRAALPGVPVLGVGYSNGANILASVLFSRPDLFDAVVLMHPLIPFEPAFGPGIAGRQVLITAGRRDPICPPALTKRLDEMLTKAGARSTILWHDGGHEVRPAEIEAARSFLLAAGVTENGDV